MNKQPRKTSLYLPRKSGGESSRPSYIQGRQIHIAYSQMQYIGNGYSEPESSMFGRNNTKIEFDARQPPQEIMNNAQAFSYVHNFKVHFKRGVLQALANKVDVSVNSNLPQLPSIQQVTDEFNQRMIMSNAHSDTRSRYSTSSFHITNIEYKESMALSYGVSTYSQPQTQQIVNQSDTAFCKNCGNSVTSDSKFCNKCGTQL